MGYFYAGGKTNQRVNGYGKMGETNQKYLSARVAAIRHSEGNFVVFKYLEIPNSTQAVTRAVEGHVRFMLERVGYQNVQNDHFVWRSEKGQMMQDYINFTDKAIEFAKQYCEMVGIKYVEKVGKTTVKKTVTHKKKTLSRCAEMIAAW